MYYSGEWDVPEEGAQALKSSRKRVFLRWRKSNIILYKFYITVRNNIVVEILKFYFIYYILIHNVKLDLVYSNIL
jgi:hypothetical protein